MTYGGRISGASQLAFKDPDPHWHSVLRSEQLLQETRGVDQWNHTMRDFIDPLHWFPVATDQIVGLSLKVDRVLSA